MEALSPQTLFTGQQVVWLPECASTNSEAQALVGRNRATDGCVVITDKQTAGRGQRGNRWEATPGENLTMSVVWRPTFLPVPDQFLLSQVVALAVYDWAASLLGPDPALRVKWPNDILFGNKKLGGILIENTLSGTMIQHSVVGIGMNINQCEFEVNTATSLASLTGRAYVLSPLASRLLEHLEQRYLQLRAGHLMAIRQEYRQVLFGFRKPHQYEVDSRTITGEIQDVDHAGRLVVEIAGQLHHFDLKEIRHII